MAIYFVIYSFKVHFSANIFDFAKNTTSSRGWNGRREPDAHLTSFYNTILKYVCLFIQKYTHFKHIRISREIRTFCTKHAFFCRNTPILITSHRQTTTWPAKPVRARAARAHRPPKIVRDRDVFRSYHFLGFHARTQDPTWRGASRRFNIPSRRTFV